MKNEIVVRLAKTYEDLGTAQTLITVCAKITHSTLSAYQKIEALEAILPSPEESEKERAEAVANMVKAAVDKIVERAEEYAANCLESEDDESSEKEGETDA